MVSASAAADGELDKSRRERLHWDGVARGLPDFFAAASTQYYRECEIALIRRAVGRLAGRRVLKLDLWNEACNTRILDWMSGEGAETYGIDLSSITTHRARRNSPQGTHSLVQSDVRRLPFHDGSFDFVYTMGTIEHIREYEAAVREIHRVLRPGGRAVIGVPHRWNVFLRPLLVSVLERFDRYPYKPEKSFSWPELREVVRRSGLHCVERGGILAIPGVLRMADLFLFRRNVRLGRVGRAIFAPFEALETRYRWPGYFGYLVAAVAEKPGVAAR